MCLFSPSPSSGPIWIQLYTLGSQVVTDVYILRYHGQTVSPIALTLHEQSMQWNQCLSQSKTRIQLVEEQWNRLDFTTKRQSNYQALSQNTSKPKKWLLEPHVVPEVGWPGHDNSALLRSNMKRSFHYRKITLRQEKPLFVSKQDGADSSDEEGENENGGADMTIHEEHVTKVCPNIAVEPSTTSGIDTRHN